MRRSVELNPEACSASQLRREISTRNLAGLGGLPYETTIGAVPCVVYREDEQGAHGNFFPASYRRIRARPEWSRRLEKAYSASNRIVRGHERMRAELDCANSSDALLMNIFCAPATMRAVAICRLLGVERGMQPEFGIRVQTPLRGESTDRTEADMRVGDLLVEAKLGESDFQTARPDLMERYDHFERAFDVDRLLRRRGQFDAYQLLRGVLAAMHHECRFAVFCDARRGDLQRDWFHVLSAIPSSALRSRMLLVTWQEIAACVCRPLQQFLSDRYGIVKVNR